MKSDQEIMNSIRAAINDCTRGIEETPSLQFRIAQKAKGEEPVVKKISTTAIIAIALIIVTMTAALAAGLGLFGELAQNQNADNRLPQLDDVSEPMSVSLVTDDGITIEIGQAYYEGNRVFISYRLSGNLFSVELHDGAPEENDTWPDVLENTIAAETFGNDIPELQRLLSWLDGKGQRWGTSNEAALHDGLYLEDGTYLDIIGGDEMIQDDGSIIGWKECVIPADHLSDTLTFKAVLFRGKNTMFQDGNTLKWLYQRGDSTDVFFTLKRNDRYVFLKGSAGTAVYQARAELASGSVDLKGSVRVIAPEKWVKIWTSWENEENLDVIESWNLYQNGVLISDEGMQSIRTEGAAEIIFELLYQHMESVEGLSLVPVFSQSGEHMNEAIRIERMIK